MSQSVAHQQKLWREAQARHRAGPEGRAKAAAKTRAWRVAKIATAEGRAQFNAAQGVRKRRRMRDPLRWPTHICNSLKQRAKKRGLPFALLPEDIVIPDVCPVLGTPFNVGAGYKDQTSPSVDRLRPHLGYVRGNIRVISLRANNLRNDASADELRRVYEYALSVERLS